MSQDCIRISWRRRQIWILLGFTMVTGFVSKYYRGPGDWWVNDFGPASVAYEIFFIFLLFLLFPHRQNIFLIVVSVFLATCFLEFLQLWQPTWLQMIRSTFLGRVLLGDTFSWWDFPSYFVGCFFGWFLLRWISGRQTRCPISERAGQTRTG